MFVFNRVVTMVHAALSQFALLCKKLWSERKKGGCGENQCGEGKEYADVVEKGKCNSADSGAPKGCAGDFANYDKITEFDIFRNLIYTNLEIRFIKRVLYLNTCLIKYGAPIHQKK